MNLLQLLHGAEVLVQSGNPSVSGLEYDSRRVKPGDAFVAMRGEASDGNKFIDRAIAAGAVAIVSDSAGEKPRAGVAWVQVPHGRRALARLSANFYKRPAERMTITGITGTNGKSTTAFLLEAILSAANRKSALIGTIEYHVAGKILPAPHTTPEALDLNRILAEALGNGATEAVMEVSSHALAQGRVHGLPFDVAIFTNLTRDHLDFHGTMENYFAAKRKLFDGSLLGPPRVAVVNIEDAYGAQLALVARKAGSEIFSYGIGVGEFRAGNIQMAASGMRFALETPIGTAQLQTQLTGRVNAYNLLAASAAAFARGLSLEEIRTGVASLLCVPGRFQTVDAAQPFTVVVDYAHTDDALRNLIMLAREFVTGTSGKVITLFGCGGDRDKTKRPLMGRAAGEGSDFVVLTSDNPRSEEPEAILRDVVPGLTATAAKYVAEVDRSRAIRLALETAQPGDIVLIAGKGHEKTQTLKNGTIPFDDAEVAAGVLKELQSGVKA